MDSIRQDPFTGIGKPEALKHQYKAIGREGLAMNTA